MWQTTGNATWAAISYLSDPLSLWKLPSSLTAALPSLHLSLSLELCSAFELDGLRAGSRSRHTYPGIKCNLFTIVCLDLPRENNARLMKHLGFDGFS